MTRQITNKIMMIRPASFGYNAQTAVNNSFQSSPEDEDKTAIVQTAKSEFDDMVEKLRINGIDVLVVEDSNEPLKPDAIFPNNWISFHDGNTLITYPMFAENRRIERRQEIIEDFENTKGYDVRYKFEFYEETW